MTKTRTLVLAALLATGLVAGGVAGVDRISREPGLRLVTTTAAPTDDGKAYAAEAIENLRVAGAFRFTQVLAGSGASDLRTGDVTGAVELAQRPEEEPRYRSVLKLKTPKGEDVALDSIAIGEDVHVKGPKQTSYKASKQKAKKNKGKGAGPSSDVAVVDPVMQLLEPVDALPASAYGAPSALDSSGRRSVVVALPEGATLTLVVDDATRTLRTITFARDAATATYTLTDVGSSDVQVPDPS